MIFTERTITIRNDSSTINAPVILYRGDKNVEVRFTLVESPYKYSNRDSINVIESTDASYAQLVIKTPNDRDPIFGDITAVGQSNVIFMIGYDMIDEIEEVGTYDFQIRLFDADQTSMATIPEVTGGFIIKEPIAKEDTTNNITNSAIVGSAVVTSDVSIPTFVGGSYNKTAWHNGTVISRQKLDKIEDGIYETYELSKDNSSQIKERARKSEIGTPLIANTISEMTDTTKVYVYVGNEEGYTNGNWYSYNGSSWVSGGVYNSQGVGFKQINKEMINDSVFKDDELTISNIQMNSTSRNKFFRLFYFKSNKASTKYKVKGTLKQDITKPNYIPQIVVSFCSSTTSNAYGGSSFGNQLISTNSNETYFEFEAETTATSDFIRLEIAFFVNNFDDVDLFSIYKFEITKNDEIVDLVNEQSGLNDVATYDYNLLMTGMDKVVSSKDIEIVKNEIKNEIKNGIKNEIKNEIKNIIDKEKNNNGSGK